MDQALAQLDVLLTQLLREAVGGTAAALELKGRGGVVKQLLLPAVEHVGGDAQHLSDCGDRLSTHHVALERGGFGFGRKVAAGAFLFGHVVSS